MSTAIKEYRDENGLTCEAFGKMVGVSRATVSRWEGGSRKVDVHRLAQVEQVTGIPRAQLRPDIFGE